MEEGYSVYKVKTIKGDMTVGFDYRAERINLKTGEVLGRPLVKGRLEELAQEVVDMELGRFGGRLPERLGDLGGTYCRFRIQKDSLVTPTTVVQPLELIADERERFLLQVSKYYRTVAKYRGMKG